jgi:hypothetical protein
MGASEFIFLPSDVTPYAEPNQTPMNTDYTEQPFNLETALNHPEWVYFRNGEKPLEWHWFEKAKEDNFPIISIDVRGNKISTCRKGFFNASEILHGNDLILRVPYVTKFANIYYDTKKAFFYDSEEEANNNAAEHRTACVPVKIPAI